MLSELPKDWGIRAKPEVSPGRVQFALIAADMHTSYALAWHVHHVRTTEAQTTDVLRLKGEYRSSQKLFQRR